MLSDLTQDLFCTDDIKNVSITKLSDWVKRYPYASVVYLLYIKRKYYTGNKKKANLSSDEHSFRMRTEQVREVEKLFLFYEDPFWIHFLLRKGDKNKGIFPFDVLIQSKSDILSLKEDAIREEKDVETNAPLFSKPRSIKEITKEMLPSLLSTPIKNIRQAKLHKKKTLTPSLSVGEEKSVPLKKESVPAKKNRKNTSLVTTESDTFIKKTSKKNEEVKKTAKSLMKKETQSTQSIKKEKNVNLLSVSKKRMNIKKNLSAEDSGTDVKSLTYWLKNTKKVSGSIGTNYENEAPSELGIYTLTMATLYENQGQYEKALKVYEHLSLQNPEKKAFFAKKIAQIKKMS